jgi:dihydroorotate dehydrogenase
MLMGLITTFARTGLFQLDAETAHRLTLAGLKTGHSFGLLPNCANNRYPQLAVKLAGLDFPNPVGIGAGFDKNGEVPDALMKLGFGFAEIGTVTPRAQPGNPRPRVFRLVEDRAVINRLGFNNSGHQQVFNNLDARSSSSGGSDAEPGIVGINIGANKDSSDFIEDYELGLKKFWSIASYFTVNISSPNTPGLRNLQDDKALGELLKRINAAGDELAGKLNKSPPVFLKIAPDLSEAAMDTISERILASSIEGLVISNTTIARKGLAFPNRESGGLSGRPLFEPSTIVLAKMRQRIGTQLPIIGIGGIDDVQSAWEKIEAGANLLQLYTGLIYQGPAIANNICRGLADRLKSRGIGNIASLTGSKTREWAEKTNPAGQ